ncbi:MAG: hypothetical protein JRJ54_07105 [Deltaproteobacteria bacterium]|nr:hypothetical protein [Deltaproteobacteria bacterium]
MEEFELEDLLRRAVGDPESVPREAKHVFSVLVKSTLEFRDQQRNVLGITVTVEDVRIALDWLLDFFRSGRLPRTEHRLRRELFETWVSALSAAGD